MIEVNGTLVNYYFHCKRQCYLAAHRVTMEQDSEDVAVGKALHHERYEENDLKIENIAVDKITDQYLEEFKKSDADLEAARWQLLFYLSVLKRKGINRKGRLIVSEAKKSTRKTEVVELTEEKEKRLEAIIEEIEALVGSLEVPPVIDEPKCKKCAYWAYCYL